MPLYHQFLTMKPEAASKDLLKTLKACIQVIQKNGGVVRQVENHGIRTLPYRFRSRHASPGEGRYFYFGRFISTFFDASPTTLKELDDILGLDENMLRRTNLKPKSLMEAARASKHNLWETTHLKHISPEPNIKKFFKGQDMPNIK
uniref:30S ribosomal protein S6, chloroplastic n=1 Tax=Fibrocapsa japonica TaxID=94617 RepID=A0A7S2V599_9STRA|mmetsp:Transcript_7790/g.11861  ORF Transcript_7790/g.11861 Transcript_7790/m.11861 type:complete len:146 (+) Transcript_7790:166-603(+)